MALRDLLRPRHAGVRAAAGLLLGRLRDAVQTPPQPNRYVAPRLRQLDAVAFALRGYRVFWTTPTPYESPDGGAPNPSTLVYEVSRWRGGDRRYPVEPVLVELPTLLPGEAHRVASWLEGARTIGFKFAWWQVQREAQWVLQRRGMRKAKRSGR